MNYEAEVEMLLSYAQNAPGYFIWLLYTPSFRNIWLAQSPCSNPQLSANPWEDKPIKKTMGPQADLRLTPDNTSQSKSPCTAAFPEPEEELIEAFLEHFDKNDILAYCANKLPTTRSRQLDKYRMECSVCEELVQGYYLLLRDFGTPQQVVVHLAEKKRQLHK